MIPFDHVWKTDPETGVLRCYKRARRELSVESKVLAVAIAARLRRAVQMACASVLDVEAAIVHLYGWGRIDGGGLGRLLEKFDQRCNAHIRFLSLLEDRANELMEGWADGEPADYTAAREASRERLRREFPNLDPRLLDGHTGPGE